MGLPQAKWLREAFPNRRKWWENTGSTNDGKMMIQTWSNHTSCCSNMSMRPTVSKKNGFHNPEIKKWNRQNNDEHKLNQRVMFRILVHPGAQAALTLFGCTIVVTIWESRTSKPEESASPGFADSDLNWTHFSTRGWVQGRQVWPIPSLTHWRDAFFGWFWKVVLKLSFAQTPNSNA